MHIGIAFVEGYVGRHEPGNDDADVNQPQQLCAPWVST
jgi:hypothetical protein